jgi:hypothetical protein
MPGLGVVSSTTGSCSFSKSKLFPSMSCDDDEDCCCSSFVLKLSLSSFNVFNSVCVGRSWDFSVPAARCFVDCSVFDFIVGNSCGCR